jgi:hypothetical protein
MTRLEKHSNEIVQGLAINFLRSATEKNCEDVCQRARLESVDK